MFPSEWHLLLWKAKALNNNLIMTKFRCFTKILSVIFFVCALTADGSSLTRQEVLRTNITSDPTQSFTYNCLKWPCLLCYHVPLVNRIYLFYHLTCTSFFLWMPGDSFTLNHCYVFFLTRIPRFGWFTVWHLHTPINSTTCLLHIKKLYFFVPSQQLVDEHLLFFLVFSLMQ